MNLEVLPNGTKSLLEHLGYELVRPDNVVEHAHWQPAVEVSIEDAVPMNAHALRQRRTEGWMQHKYYMESVKDDQESSNGKENGKEGQEGKEGGQDGGN